MTTFRVHCPLVGPLVRSLGVALGVTDVGNAKSPNTIRRRTFAPLRLVKSTKAVKGAPGGAHAGPYECTTSIPLGDVAAGGVWGVICSADAKPVELRAGDGG